MPVGKGSGLSNSKGGFMTYHLGLVIDSFLEYRDFARVTITIHGPQLGEKPR